MRTPADQSNYLHVKAAQLDLLYADRLGKRIPPSIRWSELKRRIRELADADALSR